MCKYLHIEIITYLHIYMYAYMPIVTNTPIPLHSVLESISISRIYLDSDFNVPANFQIIFLESFTTFLSFNHFSFFQPKLFNHILHYYTH